MRLPATLSLRMRLLLAGTIAIVAAVAIAAFSLSFLFRQHVEGWVERQLNANLVELVSAIDRDSNGNLVIKTLSAEPRFGQPFSGMYWEIALPSGKTLRSRSLWDQELKLQPVPRENGGLIHVMVAGPKGEALYAVQRRVVLSERLGREPVIFAVAIDDSEVRRAVWDFSKALLPFLVIISGLLAAAAWVQVRVGLRPLERIQAALSQIRSGKGAKLGSDWPGEVQPLVGEIDSLLQAQEQRITKARARAADLAHGLKTPLQVMRAEARQLAGRGDAETAANLEELVTVMGRHVDRQMVRARLGEASGNAEADLAAGLQQVLGITKRSPEGVNIDWHVEVPQRLFVKIDPDDLVEALGNLLENASRHARGKIWVSARQQQGYVTISVRDDGPGIPGGSLEQLLQRGVRLDTSSTGAGLGLSIVQDITEAWDGELSLENRAGGFVARVILPAAQRAT